MSMQNEEATRETGGRPERAFSDPETLCAEVEAYIAAKPFQSLAMALLAGIVVGRIIL